ncbi:MAG: membrane fusion protein (multidrug efflux system) [Lentimonas sp.]|jgi:membrane fusion protein (multidrug efflux system)
MDFKTKKWKAAVGLTCLLLGFAFILLAISVTTLKRAQKHELATSPSSARNKGIAMPVVVHPVELRSVSEALMLSGHARPLHQITLNAPISGLTILQNHVSLGKRVKKGELLIQFDDLAYRNSLAVDLATVELERLKLKNNQKDYERYLAMLSNSTATSLDTERAEEAIAKTRADLISAEAAVKEARSSIEKCKITAPFDGLITECISANVNQVSVNTQLVELIQTEALWVVCEISETYISSIKSGMPAVVKFTAYPNESYLGTVEKLLPWVDEKKLTSQLYIRIENTSGRIVSGMSAVARLNRTEFGIATPSAALFNRTQETASTFSQQDKTAELNRVQLGPSSRTWTIVRDGLHPAAEVIVGGLTKLEPNDPIQTP